GQLAEDSTLLELAPGAVVVDGAAPPTDEIWAVYRGQVQRWAVGDDAGEPLETVNPGEIFGFRSLLTGESAQFTARMHGPGSLVRLPGQSARPVFSRPAGLSYLAGQVSTGVGQPPVPFEAVLGRRPVGALLHAEPVLVPGETSVRDAVRRMSELRSSYVLIPLDDGEYGIFTDRDLRTRVVAADRSVSEPVRTVMSAPARVVSDDRLVSTVLIEMIEHGMRHMPVVNGRGQVLGVLEDSDLLAASTRRGFVLRRSIALSATAEDLVRASTGITDLVVDLVRGGTDAIAISGILSVMIDSVARRALELSLGEDDDLPPARFAWITLGSIARREAMPSSDLDTAMSWPDDAESDAGRYLGIAHRVHEILEACALPADRNGALASSRRFARSSSAWLRATQQWMAAPLEDHGLVMSSLLVDGRVIWGDPALHTVPVGYRRMRLDHPEALRLQLLDALSTRVWQRSFRNVLSRRAGTLDLKAHAVTPVVNLARWGGLSVGMASATTPARLAGAARNDLLTEGDARLLEEIFLMLQRIRMRHQVDQITAGRVPGDVVALGELTPLNRSLLAESAREVAAVQKRVSARLTSPSR
ncbi:MAG: putative nucleotidyltransferase substrate binding domain-containing protein, partial [Propionibacteriaceae bacterium]